jgi:predicted phosphate transport protein (TIGR00153 family)
VDVAKLVERRFREWPNGPSQDEVKALEHEADRVVSELLVNVNAQFVTPYDRDDLVRLAFAVDDVADAAENAAELLGLYGVVSPTKQSFELVGLLVQACEHLAVLLGGLHDRERSEAEIVAIKTVEDEADVAARAARASLFKDDAIDPMIVIRWKGIYEALEDAVDACETAAHRVGNILVKNA